MLSRTVLIALGYVALALSPAFAQGADLVCDGEARGVRDGNARKILYRQRYCLGG